MIKKYRLNFVYTMDVYADDEDKAAEIGYMELETDLARQSLYAAQFALVDEIDEVK